MLVVFSRMFQLGLNIAARVLPWREPKRFEGTDARAAFAQSMVDRGHKKVLVVTDKTIVGLGIMNKLLEELTARSIEFVIYDGTVPNPTVKNIEEGLALYRQHNCSALIAFGGGSSMDCAKGIGARAVKPHKPVNKMAGLFKILKRLPDLYAVPTTAGTGSETTLAAVITDDETHHKYSCNDLSFIPRFALLDPEITRGLPPHITATTGMDALTHAVEAFIGRSNTKYTEQCAIQAVRKIFAHLYTAYTVPDDLNARAEMLDAAYLAGVAFTRAYVGNVHALSHALSGMYGTPHGLANAVILPYVLDYYGKSARKRLAKLADCVQLTDEGAGDEVKAKTFITTVKKMNADMRIPDCFDTIKDADIDRMVSYAYKEAVPLYPVPRQLEKDDLHRLYKMVQKK